MNRKGEALLAWSGLAAIIVFIISWVLCFGWLIPPSPNLGAHAIASVYLHNLTGIRIGVILMVGAGALTVPFSAIIMICMLRMKGPSPGLAYSQFALGALQVLLFIIPAEMFAAVAYRPERLPEITQFGNDMAWLLFDMVVSMTIVQWVSLGLAILWDESRRPVFPRWYGYYNLWSAVLILPNNLILFFKTGPFTWNGILGWYLGATAFCVWYLVSCPVVVKAVKEYREADSV